MAKPDKKEKPTWADLLREVKDAGGRFDRQGASSNQIWKMPGGTRVTLQLKHPTEQVTRRIRDRIRDAIEEDKTKLPSS